MTHSDQTPKLPTWIFIVTDLVCLGAAAVIAWQRPHPFSDGTTLAIVVCVVLGAIAGLVPIVAYYERQKNETLDDRQRALEALARTVSSSAEQISIAATGLNGIAELSLKNLRHAEHLPQKLQEKIAEFQAQLATANDADKEELEKELAALRTSESERLESISDKISRSAADWAKLESSTQKNLAASKEVLERAATDALAHLSGSTSAAVAQAATAATSAIAQASAATADAIAAATTAAGQSLAQTHSRAAAELDEKLAVITRAVASASVTADALAALETKIAASAERLERALAEAAKAPPPPAPLTLITPPPATIVTDPVPDEPATPPVAPELVSAPEDAPAITPPAPEAPAHPPKRPRKPRREQPASDEAPAPVAAVVELATPVTDSTPPATEPTPPAAEPAPVPAEAIAEVAPVAPPTIDPFAAAPADAPAAEPTPAPAPPEPVVESSPAPEAPEPVVESSPPPEAPAPVIESPTPTPEPVAVAPAVETPPDAPDAAPEDEAPKPIRKRAPKPAAPEADPEPGLGLEIDDSPAPQSAEVAERTLTSDGATRLVVTAYIGIGNRLFIRGEGPGLSWEKGVPLQFVSIGKWRWETADATAPVSFKLYKNDSVECTALGAQNLDPGHQQELTASF